ncbi:glycosyltransferase [Salisediminibacterium halotolerans]|uniref:Glycosyl transferase family 2 n=1 Tax=Salisediminibacterium halotolerans TaxID=517425 RepID=A0A1H9QI20_9BACI|nr:glycosyltransferase [Salisediminibacterium haloalkalitolerans]SER60067.1 Glycosyl transferase family 2 [Salisediminibacterium haloalkalitolerans]
MTVKVSINCITYNHALYVRDALDSFLMQRTTFPFEVLIHDDASTDGTAEIIESYRQAHPEIIKPYVQRVNQYSRGNVHLDIDFNVSRAEGEYIAICEGDDYWSDPDKLQKQIDLLEADPELIMTCHAASKRTENGAFVEDVRPYPTSRLIDPADLITNTGDWIATNSMVVRRRLYDELPAFYRISPVGDYALQLLAAARGKAYYLDEMLSVYRVGQPGSWTTAMYGTGQEQAKRFTHASKLQETLRQFDRDTSCRLTKPVQERLTQLRYTKKLLYGDRSVFQEPYYRAQPLAGKCKARLQVHVPALFQQLSRMRLKWAYREKGRVIDK